MGIDDKHQRVVIESDVVDALLEDKQEKADSVLVAEEKGTPVQADNDSSSNSETESDSAVSLQRSGPQADTTQPVVKFSFSREELKALSPRAYTVQLAAMTSMADVQAFLDKHQLNDKVRIYPTLRSDKEWYIVTYRDYPTIQQARDAVETLPGSLKSLGPWAKSLSQVQREIERVK